MTEDRDFDVEKSEDEWHAAYNKHDLLEDTATEFLQNNDFSVEQNGIDKRDEKVWEAGDDEPDIMAKSDYTEMYIDWKAKTKKHHIGKVNKRSYNAYATSDERVFLCFGLIDEPTQKVLQMLFADVQRTVVVDEIVEWDKNDVVKLGGEAFLSSIQFAEHFGNGTGACYRKKDDVLVDPRPRPSTIDEIKAWGGGWA